MKIILPIVVFIGTGVLALLGLWSHGPSGWSVGEGTNPTYTSSPAGGEVQQQTLVRFLENVQRRDWDAAYSQLANPNEVDRASLIRDLSGSNGGLRTSSTLVGWDLVPLHATDSDGDIQATLHWSTPVGSQDTERQLKVVHQENAWKVKWPVTHFPDLPAQVIPVTYLRWDLVSPTGTAEWGDRGVDGPQVRITSMNAVSYKGGTVVMGEAVNEDTVPAFINVNATLIGEAGKTIGDESSFDKVLHVLLPKQVTPYRIDFPDIELQAIKNVRMDIKTTLVPASADPVIGVMSQTINEDGDGGKVLRGELLNQSGQIVNIPHVIATFYDKQGKVVWVSDGYVDRPLFPETPEAFSLEVPKTVAANAQTYHVVVNEYSLGKS